MPERSTLDSCRAVVEAEANDTCGACGDRIELVFMWGLGEASRRHLVGRLSAGWCVWVAKKRETKRTGLRRTWVRLGERGRRDRFGARRGESLFSPAEKRSGEELKKSIAKDTPRVGIGKRAFWRSPHPSAANIVAKASSFCEAFRRSRFDKR